MDNMNWWLIFIITFLLLLAFPYCYYLGKVIGAGFTNGILFKIRKLFTDTGGIKEEDGDSEQGESK